MCSKEIFGLDTPKADKPKPVETKDTSVKEDADKARSSARVENLKRRQASMAGGRRSTILTGGQGDTDPLTTLRKTLLGG